MHACMGGVLDPDYGMLSKVRFVVVHVTYCCIAKGFPTLPGSTHLEWPRQLFLNPGLQAFLFLFLLADSSRKVPTSC